MLYSGNIASLDVQLDDEESACLKDLIPDTTYNPEDQFMKQYTRNCILEILAELKEGERDIMMKRYNLDNDGSTYTLKAIGAQYGVSAETIRQVELRAIRKLKNRSAELRAIAYT